MNNKKLLKATVTIFLCLALLLCSCTSPQMRKYYANKSNYITATGTVNHFCYDVDSPILYLEFSDLTPRFDDDTFKIVGKNFKIVQEKEINKKIKIGDKIDFITAPRYFSDGYVMPIVSVTVNGEELLTFKDGFNNLQEWLSH